MCVSCASTVAELVTSIGVDSVTEGFGAEAIVYLS